MSLTFLCAAAIAVDGDTLRCGGIGRVRLARIDAPELHGCPPRRRCAPGDPRASRDNLARLIAAGPVRCRVVDANPFETGFQRTDRYGRPVARCSVGGHDLGDAQLRGGHAVRWPAQAV
ncbi:thermonuclease family protein [Sphingomonas sp.]|uniref:thermonuclease family protein n=1 Tax=Sphingomonas sp. TaxID=28214 RepID=UPI003BAAC8D8